MNNETYNGYTNYATWRVMIDFFDDYVHNLDEEERDALAATLTQTEVRDIPTTLPMSEDVNTEWETAADNHTLLRDNLRDDVNGHIEAETLSPTVRGWAQSFIEDVDWMNVADSLIHKAREYEGGDE